jgi:hypothetical protein
MAIELDSPTCRGQWTNCESRLLLPDLHEAGPNAWGEKIVPERIRENRQPYYEALRAADRSWDQGHFNVEQLADYLSGLLKAQLADID